MTGDGSEVVVIACSGIGKPYGTVSREAAWDLCDELRPGGTRLLALAKLVLGEEEARACLRSSPALTIDGCQLRCASKLVTLSGGRVAHEVTVLDVYRRHKDLKPEGLAELNEGGRRLARVLAEELAEVVDALRQGEAPAPTAAPAGGRHA
jgi:uncharacterized metal-binding protein